MTDHSAKLAIMLIPESLEDLNNLTCAAGQLPGFFISSKELFISPVARLPWGLAFTTLFVKGDPAGEINEIDQVELRKSIHKVLQGSIVIKSQHKLESYKKVMDELKNDEVSNPTPTDLWPNVEETAEDYRPGTSIIFI